MAKALGVEAPDIGAPGSSRGESPRPASGQFGSPQWDILERIARGASLDESLLSIVSLGEHDADNRSCSILLFDASTNELRHGAALRLAPELCRSIDGLPVGPDVGSCGSAAFRRQRVVVTDIATHSSWAAYREPFLKRGLHACWSTPILSPGGDLLGTLAMYFSEPRGPTPDECAWVDAAIHLATIALTRAGAERANERLLHTLEEQVKELTQLRRGQRIQALGTLAGGIAHDFNNILTAISGYTHLGLNDIEEERSPQESLLAIQEASARAVDLVRRILMFSRYQQPELEVCSLVPIIEEALQHVRSTLAEGVCIETRYPSMSPLVCADSAQLHQVVMNLGANAADAIGERGTIQVVVDSIAGSHEELQNDIDVRVDRYVRITLSDTGAGMDDTILERIFEPFFTTKPTGRGTGLGLSVVHGIVNAHQGSVTVQSRPGTGTVFRIYLPEAPAEQPRRELVPASKPPGTGGRVMYVDDEEPLVVLATRWLGRLGYEVTGFSDSRQALEAFQARPFDFDAVISDFSMPGLSGLDLVREIVKVRNDVVVVMSSGYLKLEDHRRAKDLGAVDVVLKPQSMAEFGRILHRILSQQRAPAEPP